MTREEIIEIFNDEIENLSEMLKRIDSEKIETPTRMKLGKVEVVQHGDFFYARKMLEYSFITKYKEENLENLCAAIKQLTLIEQKSDEIFQKIWELAIQKGDTPQ